MYRGGFARTNASEDNNFQTSGAGSPWPNPSSNQPTVQLGPVKGEASVRIRPRLNRLCQLLTLIRSRLARSMPAPGFKNDRSQLSRPLSLRLQLGRANAFG